MISPERYSKQRALRDIQHLGNTAPLVMSKVYYANWLQNEKLFTPVHPRMLPWIPFQDGDIIFCNKWRQKISQEWMLILVRALYGCWLGSYLQDDTGILFQSQRF